jgi:hypothetical protein
VLTSLTNHELASAEHSGGRLRRRSKPKARIANLSAPPSKTHACDATNSRQHA